MSQKVTNVTLSPTSVSSLFIFVLKSVTIAVFIQLKLVIQHLYVKIDRKHVLKIKNMFEMWIFWSFVDIFILKIRINIILGTV